jgi:hypothetical protein
MNYRQFMFRGIILVFAFSLQFRVILAQEEPQQQEPQPLDESKPKPAARSFPVIDPSAQDDNQYESMQADFTPLTGVQNATLGSPGIRHSYWVPGLQYALSTGPSSSNGSGSSSWFAENYFLGNLSLVKAWSRSQLAVNYSGGGFVSSGNNQSSFGNNSGSGVYQQLALSQYFQINRWLFQILDQFSKLPQSQFGFGIGTNLGAPGVGGSLGVTIPGLSYSAVPNQSIFSTNGPVSSNTGVLQATYSISPRSSITAAGAYGILRFVDPGNVDSDTILGSLGYNYSISAKDNVGITYRFDSFHYQGLAQAYGVHYPAFAYSRKITGRLALQLFVGPEIITYRIPVGTASHSIGFNFSPTLNYSTHHGGISASFVHGLSGGSGVLVGSTLDEVQFSGNRRLGRVWSGNVNFGYAHNASIANSGQPSTSYNSFFGGAGLNRPIARNLFLGLSYAAYFSETGLSNCTGPSCSSSNTTQTINLSLQWNTRPFVLE